MEKQLCDIILFRELNDPISIKIDGYTYGNWRGAFLYLGNSIPLPEVQAIFRATPPLTNKEINSIQKAFSRRTSPSKWQRFLDWIRALFSRERLSDSKKSTLQVIGEAYAVAGRKISPVVPCEMGLHHIDGSKSLVRII